MDFDIQKALGDDYIDTTIVKEEISNAYKALENIDNAIAIFGSARTKEGHEHYEEARKLAFELAQRGHSIITGAGPGIMQAANQGAKEGNGVSIGLHIHLPNEQEFNPYLDIKLTFKHFFTRKLIFEKFSQAYIMMAGGMGTIDEFSEIMVLMQTAKIKKAPLIFYNKSYWQGFISWLEEYMLEEKYIDKEEFDLLFLVDSIEEVIEIIERYGLSI